MGAKVQLLFTIKKQNIYYFDQSKTKKTKATFILPQTNTTKNPRCNYATRISLLSFRSIAP